MVFKQNSIHRQFHGIHSIYYLPVVHRRCIILYIHTFMYVFTDKRETHSLTHTVTYKQITDNVHVLPAHHGESVSVWHCIDDVFSGAKNVLLHPNAHSLTLSSSHYPPDAGVEPLSAQDVQPKASCLSGLRQWSSTVYGVTGKKKNYN